MKSPLSLAASRMAIVMTFGALALGCGGDAGSGVPQNIQLVALTSDQAKALCNYVEPLEGGYGRMLTCPDGLDTETDADLEGCMSFYPSIGSVCADLTVGDVEGCVEATKSDICAQFGPNPACANWRACFN